MDDSFLRDWFPRLPWTVICDVLRHVPAALISEGLLKVPQLRPLLIDQYYSKELHFIISPTLRPHFCVSDPQLRALTDVLTYADIEDFLVDNPDIAPHTIKLIASLDFRSLETLLRQFRSRLLQIPEIHIHIEKYELTPDDVELLLSFPNLHKLQTGRITLRNAASTFDKLFPTMMNLKELVFLGHEIADWSAIALPPNLQNLDVSWYPDTDVATINLPETVTNIYWNQDGLSDGVFESLSFPLALKTLMVTYNSISSIDVSHLPQTLETIDLSNNNLREFKCVGETAWPPNLKSILLNNNLIDNRSIEQLQKIAWPPFLENLRLDENKFTSLEHLSGLPDSLKYLDLSDTPLISFEVTPDENDDYSFFRFPDTLDTLNIQGCRALRYDGFGDSVVPVGSRIHFPPHLQTLKLTECNLDRLSYFFFPLSLKTLTLSGNRISDLNTYNYAIDGEELVSWKKLSNLEYLELFLNHIDNLENWLPPTSLERLDLRRNRMTELTSRNTPLFNGKYCSDSELRVLNLEQNEIHAIDPLLCLPQNLMHLILSKNKLEEFVFTDAIVEHASLSRLDLSWNQIQKISKAGSAFQSRLKEIDLSKNSGSPFQMTVDEFYAVLEAIGFQATRRKHNIKSEHTARQ